ncbi:hypothetical protein H1R20_g4503, partial [Candolleomyces eurysporus]
MTGFIINKYEWLQQDSNLRPLHYGRVALPLSYGASKCTSAHYQPPISVIRTYSWASRSRHGNQTRQPSIALVSLNASVKSDDLLTALEVLQQSAPPTPLPEVVIVREVCEVVEQIGTCTICIQPIAKPYMYVVPVLFFFLLLRSTVPPVVTASVAYAFETCQFIPMSDFDQLLLARTLVKHGHNPAKVFQYNCPEYRVVITKEPVFNYPLLNILERERRSLPGCVNVAGLNRSRQPIYLFNGLFLK